MSFEDVQPRIEQHLKQQAIQDGIDQKVASLKEGGAVELFIE